MKRKPALIVGVVLVLLASLLMVPAVAQELGPETELERLVTSSTTAQAQQQLQPTEDDDSPGHETQDPVPPDHASGEVAHVALAGEGLVTVNSTRSEVRDDGSSSADVTLLAIGGEEVVGAHSDSGGPTHDESDPLADLCAGSGGQVCVGLLFAEADSTEDEDSSQAEAHGALLFACVSGGGNDPTTPECEGSGNAIGVGVATSDSTTTKDKRTGDTEAEQQTDVADICLGGETAGTCTGVGAEAAHAESKSTATDPNRPGTTERRSYVAGVEAGGQEFLLVEDPEAIAVPPGCPTEPGSIACVFLNQGESFIFTGGAASRQEAIDARVGVSGEDIVLFGHVATAETFVRNTGPQCPPVCPELTEVEAERLGKRGPAAGAGVKAGRADAGLPFTGSSIILGLVALGLMLSGGGLVGAAASKSRR